MALSSRQTEFVRAYMRIAESVGALSHCNRAKVGAVIVKDGNIVAFGYNGTPKGFCNDCEENGVTRPEVIHAEMNAVLKAGSMCQGADLYVTLSPCTECCKLIKQAGIKHVYYSNIYRDTKGLEHLKINHTHVSASTSI